ncbi:hypothetical protein C7U89_13950 [Bradyrhizobium sp. WBOS4]|nr:hypothetical protein [Bradyrhizobium sp. WBOS8]MDD1584033.1 hypothetical protein [Bradyrhizobium sp. WBOS4]UUO49585.1 hypothetical protein DCM78_23345 [Bradyrhizobium sp. WBOS04]UUO62238.1 hypothetical protein DCM80_25665 [Bradyrhizobium sp. WBOS08]
MVLAPGVCAPSVAVMWRPDRARASAIRKATGAIVQRSPGRARHKPFQPLRREGRDVSGCPVLRYAAAHAVCPWHGGPWELPAPGLPCALFQLRGRSDKQSSGEQAARTRPHVNHSPLSCPGRSRSTLFGDALQSRGPCISECAACWVPAPRSSARALQRVRDTQFMHCRSTRRHCERSEAIQNLSAAAVWIASLRSQ